LYDGLPVAARDVLAPEIGEIIGGSQREERLEILDTRMAEDGIDQEHYAPTLPSPASEGWFNRRSPPTVLDNSAFGWPSIPRSAVGRKSGKRIPPAGWG
jgi:hypothetical protein